MSHRNRRLFLLILGFVCGLVFSRKVVAVTPPSPTRLQLALNWKAEPQFGGFYALDGSVSLEILQGGSGTPTLQMLLSGKTDYAVVSADEIVIAHARGNTNIVALFAVYQKNPQALLVHASQPAKNIKELLKSEGRLLWQEGLPYAQYLIKKYGPLKIKTSPYTGGVGNFIADESLSQQCFATSEPLTLKKQGFASEKFKIFYVADSGYNPYTTVLATTRDRMQKDPAQVKLVIAQVRRGWENYLKNPSPVHKKMNALNPAMTLDLMEESERAQRALIETPETLKSGLGTMSTERWKTLVDQLYELGLIKSKPHPSELMRAF